MSAVATPELLPAEVGVPDAPSLGMPDVSPEVMAEPGDSAILGDDAEGELALPPDAPDAEDPQVTELRTSIANELRSQIQAELQSNFERDLAGLRSTKDRELSQMQTQLARAMARSKVQQDWMAKYIQDNGGDPRDLAVLENTLRTAEDAVSHQQYGTQQAVQSIHNYFDQRFTERQAETGIPLDASDPEVRQWRAWVKQNVDYYGAAATRAVNARAAGQAVLANDLAAHDALQEVGRRMDEFERNKRALIQKANADREAAAKEQAAARKRQSERGTQSTASRTGGGGGMSVEAAAAKAWELHPFDEVARMKFMTDNVADEPRQRR